MRQLASLEISEYMQQILNLNRASHAHIPVKIRPSKNTANRSVIPASMLRRQPDLQPSSFDFGPRSPKYGDFFCS